MAYRNDTEQLRARLEELEDELEIARKRIQELERPDARDRTFGERLVGGKLRIVHERVLDGELAPEAHEEIVEVLRRRFNALGQASSVGKSLGWTNGPAGSPRVAEVSISVRNGKTTLRGVERLGNLAGGLYGGIVGGVGGGGSGLIVPLAMALKSPAAIPLALVLWILVVYALVRVGFSRFAASRDRELRSVIDEVAGVARESIAREQGKKLRVDAAEPPGETDLEEPEPELTSERRARRD